ncbi:MAG: acetylglutamate kinase [Candidatus Omnitrophica bacterium]|nr:acetylglutamate kinase [Candidatus Omnitrophota bacterium]
MKHKMEKAIKKSEVLIEALPYIKRFFGKVVVIKHGGSTLADKKITKGILEDIVFMSYAGMRPVLIHGGGPNINRAMKKAGKKVKFVNGQRITDRETVHIVDKALSEVNRELAQGIKKLGGRTYGLSGRDSGLIIARKIRSDIDLGFVGEVAKVDTTLLDRLLDANIIPVVSPVGRGTDGELYNINADSSAAKIAAALKAEKIFTLTNVRGVLKNAKDPQSLFNTLRPKDVKRLIKKGIIAGGMIPKVSACLLALKGGVKKAHIVSAALPHALLLEIFTKEGIGTEIAR